MTIYYYYKLKLWIKKRLLLDFIIKAQYLAFQDIFYDLQDTQYNTFGSLWSATKIPLKFLWDKCSILKDTKRLQPQPLRLIGVFFSNTVISFYFQIIKNSTTTTNWFKSHFTCAAATPTESIMLDNRSATSRLVF